jgi:hypothetical protein
MNQIAQIRKLGNEIINTLLTKEYNVDLIEDQILELQHLIGKISTYDCLDKREIRKILADINNAIEQEELETA